MFRKTIITKLLAMLSYSNHIYMVYTPLVYAVKHFGGISFVHVLEDNYDLG